ncbi:hypothetical protein I6A84_21130 [Frankia sp. CNm7]|uniref:Integral membrane protein n=1 Tax=Frankia nepalensis TaxID=1836974 RepID=A0A937RUC5_9ACTN|nr:hypothetical protein [Frankia nepalensis]MBL7499041.1 hypothetical protein [Frankia nepalensis]MBL7515638.1 hypothetical protein [Frankia nepalensis]MBL7520525.1 hypothetical protein [Frankia nepalensis]MBL7632051.1 hypothetical protein [Frankia nepalensis]
MSFQEADKFSTPRVRDDWEGNSATYGARADPRPGPVKGIPGSGPSVSRTRIDLGPDAIGAMPASPTNITNSGGRRRRPGRGRTAGVVVLCILGGLLCVTSLVARWVAGEVLDTNAYLRTVGPLADDPAIQDAVASQVAKAVGRQLEQRTSAQDPRSITGLVAEAVAGGAEGITHRVVLDFVRSEAFRNVWIDINRVAHANLVAVLEDRPGNLIAVDEDGLLTLDLGPVVAAVAQKLAVFGLPEDHLGSLSIPVRLTEISGISRARLAADWLARAAFWLPLLTLVTLAGAVLSAVHRQRMMIIVGVGVAAVMTVFSLFLNVGRSALLGRMADGDLHRAAAAVVDQLTGSLRGEMWSTTFAGLAVAMLGAILLAARARRVRRPSW